MQILLVFDPTEEASALYKGNPQYFGCYILFCRIVKPVLLSRTTLAMTIEIKRVNEPLFFCSTLLLCCVQWSHGYWLMGLAVCNLLPDETGAWQCRRTTYVYIQPLAKKANSNGIFSSHTSEKKVCLLLICTLSRSRAIAVWPTFEIKGSKASNLCLEITMSALFCIDAHHREHVDEIGTFYTPIIVIGEIIIAICSPLHFTFIQPMHAKLLRM